MIWEGSKLQRATAPSDLEPFEPAPVVAASDTNPPPTTAIELPKLELNEQSSSLIVNSKSQRAIIGYVKLGKTGSQVTRLVMCDLKSGTVLGSITAPTAAVPLDLADDGEHIVVRFLPQAKPKEESHIEIWRWGESNLTREMRFLPMDEDSLKLNERLTFAAFLDDAHLVTLTTFNQLTFWEWGQAKRLYIYDKCSPLTDFDFTADKKYVFALSSANTMWAINTSTYRPAGYWNPWGWAKDFRLNPTGTYVLTSAVDEAFRPNEAFTISIPRFRLTGSFNTDQLGLGRLLAFPADDYALFESRAPFDPSARPEKDLKPGKATKPKKSAKPGKAASGAGQPLGTITIQEQNTDRNGSDANGPVVTVHRIDRTKVASGKVTLVDLQHKVRAWEYTGVDRLTASGPQCWCLTEPVKGQSAKLVPLRLPGKELLKQVETLTADPDYFVLKDGGIVKLDLKGLPAADREAAVPLIEKQLQQKRITVAAESDVELVFKMGPVRVQKRTAFRPVGDDIEYTPYIYRQQTMEVFVEHRGRRVHSMTIAYEPSLAGNRRPNESVQQFFDRNPGTPLEILKSLGLPGVMFGPAGNKFLGTTNIADAPPAE